MELLAEGVCIDDLIVGDVAEEGAIVDIWMGSSGERFV